MSSLPAVVHQQTSFKTPRDGYRGCAEQLKAIAEPDIRWSSEMEWKPVERLSNCNSDCSPDLRLPVVSNSVPPTRFRRDVAVSAVPGGSAMHMNGLRLSYYLSATSTCCAARYSNQPNHRINSTITGTVISGLFHKSLI